MNTAAEVVLARIERLAGYLKLDPDNPHLLMEMVESQLDAGLPEAALTWAMRGAEAHRDHPALQAQLGYLHMEAGRWTDAEAVLRGALHHAPAHPLIAYNLAWIYYTTRRFDSAVAVLREYPSVCADVAAAPALLARALHWMGEPEGALQALSPRLASEPGDADALGLCALLEFDLKRTQEAADHARAALERDAGNLEAHVVLGSLALEAERLEPARRHFEAALERKNDTGRAWLGMALAELYESHLDAAASLFEQALDLMPGHAGAWLAYGWCLLLRGDPVAARKAFEDALALDRNFSESHGSMAIAAILLGDRPAALRSMEVARRLDAACVSAGFAAALLDGRISDAASLKSFADGVLKGVTGRGQA
jgi:tetratricopeptide (TPR) repeat protein